MSWEQGQGHGVPAVHLAPDEGLQTFVRAYPALTRDGSHRGPLLPGRAVVEVVDRQGDWVRIAVDGSPVGWVEGQRLVPPVGAPARATAPVPAPQRPPVRTSSGFAARPQANGAGMTSLVLGIVALVVVWSFIDWVLSPIVGLLAVGFGWVGMRRSSTLGLANGPALAGLVLGLLATVLGGYRLWSIHHLASSVSAAIERADRQIVDADPVWNRVQIERCYSTITSTVATGTLVNNGSDTRTFRLKVQFHGPGAEGEVIGEAELVAPGATGRWTVGRTGSSSLTGCSLSPSPADPRPPVHPADPPH